MRSALIPVRILKQLVLILLAIQKCENIHKRVNDHLPFFHINIFQLSTLLQSIKLYVNLVPQRKS